MSFQQIAITMTRRAVDDLFRGARAMPADRVEWSVLDEGRTVLSQLQECAQAAQWFIRILQERAINMGPPEQMMEFRRKAEEERSQWKTVDECERVCRENSAKLYAVIEQFPDADLGVEIHLPFGGGITRTMAEMVMAHYWNIVYHLGQMNFIQTLYGDREMH